LNTEFFVLIVYIAGLVFLSSPLRELELPGKNILFVALIAFLFSNIFTVVEEYILNAFFNHLEHLFIFIGSVLLLIGSVMMMQGIERK